MRTNRILCCSLDLIVVCGVCESTDGNLSHVLYTKTFLFSELDIVPWGLRSSVTVTGVSVDVHNKATTSQSVS